MSLIRNQSTVLSILFTTHRGIIPGPTLSTLREFILFYMHACTGFQKEQIRVQVTLSGKLKITGEHQIGDNKWRRFQKEIPISPDCDKNGITANFEKGILYVRQPKIRPPPKQTPTAQDKENKLTEIGTKISDTTKEAKAALEKNLAAKKDDVSNTTKETRTALEKNLEEKKRDVSDTTKQVKADMEKNLAEKKRDLSEKTKETKMDMEKNLAEKKRDVSEKSKETRTDAEKNLAEKKRDVYETVNEAKAAIEKSLAEKKSEGSANLEKMKGKMGEKGEGLRESGESTLERYKKAVGPRVENYKQVAGRLRDQMKEPRKLMYVAVAVGVLALGLGMYIAHIFKSCQREKQSP